MALNCHLTIIFIGLCLCSLSTQSTPRFSLQTAISYLNEPLRKSYLDSDKFLVNPYLDNERGYEGYYDENSYDDDFEDKKRSMFRKRGTVFRERTREPSFQHKEQEILAEKFLKAIEDEREREEEEEYQQQLRNLWSRYQVEENDIERELFNNDFNDEDSQAAILDEMKRKRQRGGGEIEVAPSYWNQKRTMPLLPWLPAQKKKRFPVAKRSPKEVSPLKPEKLSDAPKSSDVEVPAKKECSDDVKVSPAVANVSSKTTSVASDVKKNESQPGNMMHIHVHEKRDLEAVGKAAKVKRETSSEDEEEEDDTGGHAVERESHESVEESEEEEDDDKKKKKKKRDTSRTHESPSTSSSKSASVSKRPSFEWSDLFGLDRKKKSILPPSAPKGQREEKLEEMERKLKNMEEFILQDTAKYAEIPEDNLTPSEERAVKGRVSQRLAALYSLEKLRKAVQRLRESIALGNNFIDEIYGDEEKKKAKRVAVKKEKAEFDNKDHDIDSHLKVSVGEMSANDHHLGAVDKNRKKKKRNELTNFISENEPMSEEMMGGGSYDSSSCPILDSIERKCRGIDMMNGDFHQNLLDTCGAHQLCYLCGDSQVQCDYDFLAEAEEMCDSDMKCNIIARQTLSALKSAGAVKISPRECIRNPCIRMALQTLSSY